MSSGNNSGEDTHLIVQYKGSGAELVPLQEHFEDQSYDSADLIRCSHPPTEHYNKPLGALQLSQRVRSALARLELSTIGQLSECTEFDLLGVRGFGATSLKEVRDLLEDYGLSLRLG